ncbi:putative outer membrane protein [Aquimarina sp. MAR_2010_214]|uniref:outer membrane beta-barrel protein n=1 Tax=Aquimarina sp. MAR_2010_214 TaxID=1250026 RepID=UPI000C7072F5|nr:outer membrane beta-barrel protein [Aquimarina sp. MAR_2010_214]PKV51189.1 putative outer membrane protein [Aquimarina sp. MAR_2010_214]
MTKYILFIIPFLFLCTYNIQSQEISEHTIGLRISEGDGFWAEASYQNALSSKTRMEIGLGVQGKRNYNAIKLTGTYQWVFNINEGLNWYVGPGIGGGLVDFDTNATRNDDLTTFGFVTGDIGIEYNFDFPLVVSLDFRPEIYFDSYTNDDIIFNFGVSARYKFD